MTRHQGERRRKGEFGRNLLFAAVMTSASMHSFGAIAADAPCSSAANQFMSNETILGQLVQMSFDAEMSPRGAPDPGMVEVVAKQLDLELNLPDNKQIFSTLREGWASSGFNIGPEFAGPFRVVITNGAVGTARSSADGTIVLTTKVLANALKFAIRSSKMPRDAIDQVFRRALSKKCDDDLSEIARGREFWDLRYMTIISENALRFVLIHEVAHVMLGHQRNFKSFDCAAQKGIENAADYFAIYAIIFRILKLTEKGAADAFAFNPGKAVEIDQFVLDEASDILGWGASAIAQGTCTPLTRKERIEAVRNGLGQMLAVYEIRRKSVIEKLIKEGCSGSAAYCSSMKDRMPTVLQ